MGASALACCGLGTASTIPPQIDYLETHKDGENNMPKILVAYASKAGSTGEVAGAIGEVLSSKGATVDVLQIKHVKEISAYQSVIVGSAIRMGKLLPEVVDFVQTNQTTLSQKTVAYFVNCLTMKDDTEENHRAVTAYLDPLRALTEPVSMGLFAGKLDYKKLSLMERLMISMIKVQEGDYRNWDAIRTWADQALPAM